jgi:hypothetical protein
MTPLERRYRRLLRLLPADHRDARGAELLGLLLDLDEGRVAPSLRQASGVVLLAMRLRLRDAASLVLAALLITVAGTVVGDALMVGTGSLVFVPDAGTSTLQAVVMVAGPWALRLCVVVPWLMGYRRVALAAQAALTLYTVLLPGPDADRVAEFAVLAALALVWWRRWPVPGPRLVLLACIPLVATLWALAILSDWLTLTAVIVLVGVLSKLVHRRLLRRRDNPLDIGRSVSAG